MPAYTRNDFTKGQIARDAIGDPGKKSGISRTDVNKWSMMTASTRRPLRKVEEIDPVIISLYIKDNMNRSLEDLTAQIAFECNYIYEDLYMYLSSRPLGYNKQITNNDGTRSYIMVKWTPGDDNTYYIKYARAMKNKIEREQARDQ